MPVEIVGAKVAVSALSLAGGENMIASRQKQCCFFVLWFLVISVVSLALSNQQKVYASVHVQVPLKSVKVTSGQIFLQVVRENPHRKVWLVVERAKISSTLDRSITHFVNSKHLVMVEIPFHAISAVANKN